MLLLVLLQRVEGRSTDPLMAETAHSNRKKNNVTLFEQRAPPRNKVKISQVLNTADDARLTFTNGATSLVNALK